MTKISALHDWLKQAEKLNERLKRQECIEGWLKMTLITQLKVGRFHLACEKQLESYQDRAAEIYNVKLIH